MKCGEEQRKMRTSVVRALSFSAVIALTLNPALAPVIASDYHLAASDQAIIHNHVDGLV